jgi:hypothetical protein
MAKPRVLPKPDQDYILDRIPELRRQFERDVETLERIRKLRNLDWKVNVPTRLEDVTGATGLEYRDATIADELLTLPTLYAEQDPSLSLTAEKETLGTEDLTTRLEQFTTAALFGDCGRRATGPGTLARMIDGTFEGAGWTALRKNTDIWAEYTKMSIDDYEDDDDGPAHKRKTKHDKYWKASEEAKKRAGIPVEWRAVDALTLLPIYEGDVLVAMIEIQERSLSTCLRQYGLGLDGDGNITPSRTAVRDWSKQAGSGTTCEFIQFWDKDWMSYLIRYAGGSSTGGSGYQGSCYVIPGYTRKHGYNLGRPPYYVSLGWTKNYEYARLCTWSASEPKRYAVEYISFLRTILGHLAIRDAIPPMFEELPEGAAPLIGADGKPAAPAVYELGTKYVGQPGQKTTVMTFPNTTDKIAAEIAATRQDIQALSPAGAPTGDLGGAGFALSVQHEKDRARYNQFESSIVQHLKDVTVDLWKLVAGLDDTVYVASAAAESGGHVKVDKSDFETAMRVDWTLHVDSTSAKIILERYLSARVQNGSLSVRQMIERLGDNVSEVMEQRAIDRIVETEAYKAAEEAEVWAAWGKGAAWEAKQKKAQDIAAGPAAPPGMPGMAPPPMGGPGGVPDTGSMALSPNGAGAQPGQQFSSGPIPGMPASPSVPTAGATAQLANGSI